MTGRVRVIIAGVTCAGIVGLALPGLAGDRDSGPRTTAASEQQADRLASLQRVAARALAAHMEWGIPEPRGRAAPIPTIEQSATPPQLSAEESATRLTRDRLTYAALFATSNAETQRLESLALESSNTAVPGSGLMLNGASRVGVLSPAMYSS